MSIRIATAPVSWGIWEMTIDRPDLIPPETFVETIFELGYTATETGPPGYFAPDGGVAVARAGRYGADLIATFLSLRFGDAAGFEDDLGALDKTVAVREPTRWWHRAARRHGDARPYPRRRQRGAPPRNRLGPPEPLPPLPPSGSNAPPKSSAHTGSMLRCTLTRSRTSSRRRRRRRSSRAPRWALPRHRHDIVVGDPLQVARDNVDRLRHVHVKVDRMRHVHVDAVGGALLERLQRGELDNGRDVASGNLLQVRPWCRARARRRPAELAVCGRGARVIEVVVGHVAIDLHLYPYPYPNGLQAHLRALRTYADART